MIVATGSVLPASYVEVGTRALPADWVEVRAPGTWSGATTSRVASLPASGLMTKRTDIASADLEIQGVKPNRRTSTSAAMPADLRCVGCIDAGRAVPRGSARG